MYNNNRYYNYQFAKEKKSTNVYKRLFNLFYEQRNNIVILKK